MGKSVQSHLLASQMFGKYQCTNVVTLSTDVVDYLVYLYHSPLLECYLELNEIVFNTFCVCEYACNTGLHKCTCLLICDE